MKKIILLTLLAVSFLGCSKDNENLKTITNLSGEIWYETWVWFSNSEEGELTGFDDRKLTIDVGESFTVSTGEEYFYVTFKDENGKSRMSKKQLFAGNKATVTKIDLY